MEKPNYCNSGLKVLIIDNEKLCIFIKFDIREFYLSIMESILKKSILFAKDYHHIPDEDVRIIDHWRKSLLFTENEPWKKKRTESCFDVTMNSYDGIGWNLYMYSRSNSN